MDGVEFNKALASKPSLEIDVDHYQALFDDPSLSEEQRREMLEAMRAIITAFVDLGFGVHPAQQVCGESARAPTLEGPDAVSSEQATHMNNSKKSADDDPPRER